MPELKIQVQVINIVDKKNNEQYSIKTVRTAKEIYEMLEELEKEALENKVYELQEQY